MAKKGNNIWVEGERELFVNMQRSMNGSLAAAREGLQKAGSQIVADAVQNIRNNKSWTTGQLANSGRVQRVEGDADAIDAGFFSSNTTGGYAFFVEYGRRAGKMPPVEYIKQWITKKSSVKKGTKSAIQSAAAFSGKRVGDYITSLAWAIAKSIAKKGTQPHPFFTPAVEKNKKAVEQAIAEAVKGSIK